MICVACNKEFESKNNETICPVCFQRILRDIQKPKNGTCPICGIPSKKYKYCSNRCYNIAHSALARKYYKAHSREILKKQKVGRMRKYKHGDRIDAIERIGRFIHMSYGMTRALLQRRAARDGIPLDMVIAIVQQERSI